MPKPTTRPWKRGRQLRSSRSPLPRQVSKSQPIVAEAQEVLPCDALAAVKKYLEAVKAHDDAVEPFNNAVIQARLGTKALIAALEEDMANWEAFLRLVRK